jgi:hypothetical protein
MEEQYKKDTKILVIEDEQKLGTDFDGKHSDQIFIYDSETSIRSDSSYTP